MINNLVETAEKIVQGSKTGNMDSLAEVYLASGRLEEAFALTQKTEGYDIDSRYIQDKVIKKYLEKGDDKKAQDIAKYAPHNILIQLADLQFKNGNTQVAEENLKKSMEDLHFYWGNIPEDSIPYDVLIRQLHELGETRPQSQQAKDAISQQVDKILDKIENKDVKDQEDILLHAAQTFAELGDIQKAETLAAQLLPDLKEQFHLTLAEAYKRQGNNNKGIEVLRENSDLYRRELAELLVENDQVDEAVAVIDEEQKESRKKKLKRELALSIAEKGKGEQAMTQ